ncbi:MAG: hypothetical protein LAT80_05370 [Balneolaceae bacterium]|nr:hypothetical protein [Balneolaceae bacterium]
MEKILSILRGGYRSLRQRALLSGLFAGLTLFLIFAALLIWIESAAWLSPAYKTGAIFVSIALALTAGVITSLKLKPGSFQNYLERFFSFTEDKELYSAVDLYLDDSQKESRFYHAAIRKGSERADEKDLQEKTSRFLKQTDPSIRLRLLTPLLIFSIVGLIFTASTGTDQTQRAMLFWQEFDQPNPFEFVIAPGDTTLEHGSTFQPGIRFEGDRIPNQLYLSFKTDVEDRYRQRSMRPGADGVFVPDQLELTGSIDYKVEMDGFESATYRAKVQLQPRFEELTLTVTPPTYTGLNESRHEYPYSSIRFYPGSTIELRGKTNKPVQTAKMTFNGDQIALNQLEEGNDSLFTYRLEPEASDTIRFQLTDFDGLGNRNPFRTELSIREDQYPSVVITEPTGTLMQPDPGVTDIFYQATDDFGLTRAELHWEHRRAFVEDPETGSMQLERPSNGRTEQVRWDLSELNLRPRDEVSFRIRVWDNDEISGYKWSESQPVIVQIPSLADYFEDLDSREREVESGLDQISENFRDMEREYEEFLERLRQNPDGGFEEEQMLEEIRERQESVDESIRDLNEQFEQIRNEMQQNDRVSEETRRAYNELQQLMKELDDPALREAMEELQRALENMSPQEIERALENVDFNENLYRERLERTVELFKRLKMNSDLDKLARQYEDLSERIAPGEEQTLEQLERELDTAEEDFESISRQLDELDKNPPRRMEERLRKMKEEARGNLDQVRNELEQLKQDASGGGAEGETSPSDEMKEQQDGISQQLMEQAQKFRDSIQQMSGDQVNVNIAALQRALYTLLELSDMQEYITRTSSETRNRSQGFVELARVQNNVSNQFSTVSDTLSSVSAEIPGVPNQINRKKAEVERTLGQAIDQMVERSQRGSTVSTRESLGGINDLTSMVASLIDQLMDQQGEGGGGSMSLEQMVEQMQQMSGQQQELNEQLQQMINDMQGDRLTQEESERLDQMARQQNEIRRQLRELQRRGGLDQGDRTLSEMQRMIENMEESINEMRGGVTDPLMIQRQQNILSRMLDAEESMQQRGETEEREGTAATDQDRTLPPEMTLEQLQQEIRSRLQDPNYTRFTEQYQRLIEQYFEQLRRFDEIPAPSE